MRISLIATLVVLALAAACQTVSQPAFIAPTEAIAPEPLADSISEPILLTGGVPADVLAPVLVPPPSGAAFGVATGPGGVPLVGDSVGSPLGAPEANAAPGAATPIQAAVAEHPPAAPSTLSPPLSSVPAASVPAPPSPGLPAGLTDEQIRQQLVQRSIASYPGNCPCPFNRASNGSRCGGRSAYSRGGGYAPFCYASDVPQSAVERFRATVN